MKPEPGTIPKSAPSDKKKSSGNPRQPLQERNAAPIVKSEPGIKAEPGIKDEPMSKSKSYERPEHPRRTIAAWSDDED